MTGQESIKEVVGKNGKTRYQAQVWYERKFITSKTFDSLSLARAFQKKKYDEAVNGKLLSAGERREQRQREACLERPMSAWATLYVEAYSARHGQNRLYEYEQVGRLLGSRTLRDFSSKAGGQLIRQLAAEWRYIRFTKGVRAEPFHAPKAPVSDQTLRLRLSALDRLIKFAVEQLPEEISYVGPKKPMDYAAPPAHGNKRHRVPTAEEFATLLTHFAKNIDMSDLLRVIDETGCRLSEISRATGEAVAFITAGGNVLGGVLTLHHHKTDERVGVRHVPLSRYAAQVLHARKTRCGDGPLFPCLPATSSDVCADFDKARKAVGIADLLIKDFRRGFITRNARSTSKLELASVVGLTSLLDLGSLDAGDRNAQAAAGHTDPRTTLGYVSPEHQAMAQAFTASSRWPAVAAILNPAVREVAPGDEAAELERELGEVLARMRKLGLTAVA